jgi:ABC transporter substrate binding protein
MASTFGKSGAVRGRSLIIGFIEGQNLVVDERGYGLHVEQLADHAAEIVKAQVDVILATGDLPIRAAQQATTTIPILGFTDDMLGSKFVSSLAKPGGNTTGVSILATELDGKRQDILIEAVPGLRHMAALADSSTTAVQRRSNRTNMSARTWRASFLRNHRWLSAFQPWLRGPTRHAPQPQGSQQPLIF